MEYNTRDEMLAQNVMNLYELGKFEKELAMYGCAYQDENGKIVYVMGTDKSKLFDWKYDIDNLSKYPTAVHRVSLRTVIPTGMEEVIAEELRNKMINELYTRYSKKYFDENAENKIPTNDAYQLLKEVQFSLDGIGSSEQLDLYQGLVNKAYLKKVLKEKEYYIFCQWIDAEKEDVSEDLHKTNIYEKEFYGFSYRLKDERFKVIVDGCKEYIYTVMEDKIQEGALVSPIICKKYWYDNNKRLNDVKKESILFFEGLFGMEYQKIFLRLEKIIKDNAETKY